MILYNYLSTNGWIKEGDNIVITLWQLKISQATSLPYLYLFTAALTNLLHTTPAQGQK